MKKVYINKAIAPIEWNKFKRWYKVACASCSLSVEDAYKSLGYVRKSPSVKKEE